MLGQLERRFEGDDLHFITFSCYHREPRLNPSSRKDVFLETLEQVRQRYQFRVIGYVVMPEHVHLLLSKPAIGTPSTVLQVLKQGVSRRVSEALWQRRFHDFNVSTERKRREKLTYIHRNPVARGLVPTPEDWSWSSLRHYAFRDATPVMIDSSWLDHWRPEGASHPS